MFSKLKVGVYLLLAAVTGGLAQYVFETITEPSIRVLFGFVLPVMVATWWATKENTAYPRRGLGTAFYFVGVALLVQDLLEREGPTMYFVVALLAIVGFGLHWGTKSGVAASYGLPNNRTASTPLRWRLGDWRALPAWLWQSAAVVAVGCAVYWLVRWWRNLPSDPVLEPSFGVRIAPALPWLLLGIALLLLAIGIVIYLVLRSRGGRSSLRPSVWLTENRQDTLWALIAIAVLGFLAGVTREVLTAPWELVVLLALFLASTGHFAWDEIKERRWVGVIIVAFLMAVGMTFFASCTLWLLNSTSPLGLEPWTRLVSGVVLSGLTLWAWRAGAPQASAASAPTDTSVTSAVLPYRGPTPPSVPASAVSMPPAPPAVEETQFVAGGARGAADASFVEAFQNSGTGPAASDSPALSPEALDILRRKDGYDWSPPTDGPADPDATRLGG